MAQVIWTREAHEDVGEIRRYIANDSPSAAAAMVRRLRAEAARLSRYPQIGRIVPEYDDVTVREIIVSPYRLIYRYLAEHDQVQVVSVVHARRLLPPFIEGGQT